MLPAEWYPQDAVQLTFPHKNTDWEDILDDVLPCFIEIAYQISRFQKVLIVCENAQQTANALSHAVLENILFIELPSNDTWARDHGGLTVLKKGRAQVLDFVFNGWGLKFPAFFDNRITASLSEYGLFQTPTKAGGMVLEGGAIESDGAGTLLTTAACLLSPNRNPHLSKKQIEARLKNRLGMQRVLWLHHGYLAGDDTDSHIDTLARFCDENTIAYVACTDVEDEHYTVLSAMKAELEAFRTLEGKPYVLIPLPMPAPCFAVDGHRLPATYANFLIINGAVLVPTYHVAEDAAALQILGKAFPKHSISGVDCRMLIEQHGSLHCLTMQYPKGTFHDWIWISKAT